MTNKKKPQNKKMAPPLPTLFINKNLHGLPENIIIRTALQPGVAGMIIHRWKKKAKEFTDVSLVQFLTDNGYVAKTINNTSAAPNIQKLDAQKTQIYKPNGY